MSAPALAQRDAAATWRSQRGVAITLAVGALALGLLFHAEAAAAVHVWMTSTAYNHCFLVLPIALYLVWDRRTTLRGFAAQPEPLAALAAIPLAVGWLLAERLGIMEGRQLMAMSFVELLAYAALGRRLWWQLAGPLLYLYFLVPFGDFLTPKLQDFTTGFVQHALDLLGIPAYITGYTIEIPEGTFYIAEACAGLRFLIASIAFGALYALLMYRRPWRRVAFIAASIVVPIIANGIRASGIVALGHWLGSAQAAATDHVLYGWVFFSLVILMLIGLGLPFREDVERDGATPAPRVPAAEEANWRNVALASFLVILLAAISPALALQLDRSGAPPAATVQALNFGLDCQERPVAPLPPVDTQGRLSSRRISCDGQVYNVRLVVFGMHSAAAPVLATARELGEIRNTTHAEYFETETAWLPVPGEPQRLWRLTHTSRPGPIVAVAVWVDGKPTAGGLMTRIHLAWESLVGAPIAPVVISIAPDVDRAWLPPDVAFKNRRDLVARLEQANLTAQIRRIATPH